MIPVCGSLSSPLQPSPSRWPHPARLRAKPRLPAGWMHAEINFFVDRVPHTLVLDRGRVTSASATSLTLREADGSTVQVGLAPATKITVDGRPGQLTDIRRGVVAVTQRRRRRVGPSGARPRSAAPCPAHAAADRPCSGPASPSRSASLGGYFASRAWRERSEAVTRLEGDGRERFSWSRTSRRSASSSAATSTRDGYRVIWVRSGEEATRRARRGTRSAS